MEKLNYELQEMRRIIRVKAKSYVVRPLFIATCYAITDKYLGKKSLLKNESSLQEKKWKGCYIVVICDKIDEKLL